MEKSRYNVCMTTRDQQATEYCTMEHAEELVEMGLATWRVFGIWIVCRA